MSPQKVIILACGSFNPITNMHLRMFEIARDHLNRMGNHTVIGGLISPVHDAYGKKELESASHRCTMVKLALQNTDWIKLSDWECKQEGWTRTRQVLQYHQNHLNALLAKDTYYFDNKYNEDDVNWIPEGVKNNSEDTSIQVKLLCGGDLLESFATPGLWSNEDIECIVGQQGLVVITRSKTNPLEFIYNSDILTTYMHNITIVTEWIRNEVSSSKIRRALRRSESIKYLVPDKVIDFIHKHMLYDSKQTSVLLTPSTPNDSSPITFISNCMSMCNKHEEKNNSYNQQEKKQLIQPLVNTVDGKKLLFKHPPGQAVKISMGNNNNYGGGGGVVVHKVCSKKQEIQPNSSNNHHNNNVMKHSKSCVSFVANDTQQQDTGQTSKSFGGNLKECKSCDENLIKFIFSQHGIEVISDFETIV